MLICIPIQVFLDKDRNVLLGDFGHAFRWNPFARHWQEGGSLHFLSPEVLKGESYVGPEVDCWSLGALLYTLLTGTFPFGDSDTLEIYRKVSPIMSIVPKVHCTITRSEQHHGPCNPSFRTN